MPANNSNILALDTSSTASVVVLRAKGATVSLREEGKSHSQQLLQMIDKLLSLANIELRDLHCIGVTRGPGSFTGVRIGISVAQGLAFGLKIPVVALSSLLVLAQSFVLLNAGGTPFRYLLSAIDARMNELYGCWFEIRPKGIESIGEEFVIAPKVIDQVTPDIIQSLLASPTVDGGVAMIGNGRCYIEEMPASYPLSLQLPEYLNENAIASGLLDLTNIEYMEGKAQSASSLEPIYLRDNVASVAKPAP